MKHFIFALLAVCTLSLQAQVKQYAADVHKGENGNVDLPYRYLTPENTLRGMKYPLVIFLHGSGERGIDNEKQLFHGSGLFLNPVNQEKYPAYVIIPQCPEGKTWKRDDVAPTVISLIEKYKNLPQIDDSRIYIIGLSMGAYGIYDIVTRRPDLFAVAVPICGEPNAEKLPVAKDIAFSIYHGDADQAVPVEGSREAYVVLKKAGCKHLRYTEFAGTTHNSWNPAFNTPDFLSWIFSKRRK